MVQNDSSGGCVPLASTPGTGLYMNFDRALIDIISIFTALRVWGIHVGGITWRVGYPFWIRGALVELDLLGSVDLEGRIV
jgi:hypothetical protein